MTTANGDRGRIIDQVEGTVAVANPRGIKLAGQAAYLSFSKYVESPIAPPRRGARVRLGLDADGFVRQLQILGDAAGAGAPAAEPERDHQRRRMSALHSAATFCAGRSVSNDVSSVDVLKVAEAFERWLERD
jgi:hypothetical protein